MTAATAAAVLSFAAPDAAAQGALPYDRTTFLHGIGSNDGIWRTRYPELDLETTPQYLSRQFGLGGVSYPYLNEGAPGTRDRTPGLRFAGQRDNLVQALSVAGGRHVLITHSLGSLVARGAHGARSQQVAGIVAIATPHQGVNIGSPGVADSAFGYMRELEHAVKGAARNIERIGLVLIVAGYFLPSHLLSGVGHIIVSNSAAPDLPLDQVQGLAQLAALQDMGPNAEVIRSLNTYDGDAAIPRANVVGRIPGAHAILRLAATQPGSPSFADLKRTKDRGLSAVRACAGLGNFTFNLTDAGNHCERAARMLAALDLRWEGYMNGTEYGVVRPARFFGLQYFPAIYGPVPRSIPFDGVVPNERSRYPGLTDPRFEFLAEGANHQDIYKLRSAVDRIALGMRAIGMQDPTTGPTTTFPASPFAAGISGPQMVTTGELATWSANVTGGTAPYTYQWSGVVSGTGAAAGATLYGDGRVTLAVSDATGVQLVAHLDVTIRTVSGCADPTQIVCME